MDANLVEFYDEIYTHSPRKWTNIDRDYNAFRALSEYVNEPGGGQTECDEARERVGRPGGDSHGAQQKKEEQA